MVSVCVWRFLFMAYLGYLIDDGHAVEGLEDELGFMSSRSRLEPTVDMFRSVMHLEDGDEAGEGASP